ncbi:uncharacterized protein LOC127852982 [Dreissena polymorpha]|uniref:uncharacterized protein LOC127852982 n=1 Tax=Dreissena polymorpha TaxID=45954 RepID=UPI002263E404|nr:uncharacterized protein LOC127852982 [Dreissena polymorpha]
MENTLDVVANKSGGRRKITDSGKIHVTTNSIGGQIGRPFALNIFKYNDDSNPVNQRCFLAEYCTPMQCVQTMEKGYAGISATTKQGMGESFKEKFKEIMSRRKMMKLFSNFKVSFVLFNDTDPRNRLMDLLEREIFDQECDIITGN